MNSKNRGAILEEIKQLIAMHKSGLLGGEVMPEDARPSVIDIHSKENFHFLTLPMALNYQRNSYTLWKSAAATFLDESTKDVFNPSVVSALDTDSVRRMLMKHKLALQPNKHVDTWIRISKAVQSLLGGDLRTLFDQCDSDVTRIRKFIQTDYKSNFPYLSGSKIFNYWLYVMGEYTPITLSNRHEITIAPDTHIIQASVRLGVTTMDIETAALNREELSKSWTELLKGTDMFPIDIHTPLWLWSRAGFPQIRS